MSLQGKKVAITGADGFIGSHLTEALVAQGANVRALCVYNSNGSLGWLDTVPADIRNSIDARLGDVRDEGAMDDFVRGADVVLHLAALIGIPYSYDSPRSYVDTNVVGTFNILQAVRRHEVSRLVSTSTSEVYGTPRTVPITVEHALRAQSPYSATKIAADKLCEAWADSFGTPVLVLRPFNTYGPRQSSRAVITTVLTQLLAGASELHLGSLAPKRDFTFVADTVQGFIAAATAAHPLDGSVVQLGTGVAVTIGELVDMARVVTGNFAEVIQDPNRLRPANSEVMELLGDPTQALSVLGWAPNTSLEIGLGRTAEWLREHPFALDTARYAK